jgi:ATP phosphoribosyltransferase regulatory subunit HisZ
VQLLRHRTAKLKVIARLAYETRGRAAMSILNSILGQVSENATVQNLAAKVGLSPEEAEQAIAALGQAHVQDGNTVETASRSTGIPTDKLSQIVQHIGGEGSLGQFASLLEGQGGASSLVGALKNFL